MAIKILFFLSIILISVRPGMASTQQLPPEAQLTVIVCDGLAKPVDADVSVTVEDIKSGLHWSYRYTNSGAAIHLPISALSSGNAGLYNIYVRARGYKTSVNKRVSIQGNEALVYSMLVPNHAELDLQQAHWQNLQDEDAELLHLLLCSRPGATDCQAGYEKLLQEHPDKLAALLNITEALQQTVVGGRPVFSYYQSINLEHGLFRDRFFAYVDQSLALQLKAAQAAKSHALGEDTAFTRLRFFQILHRHATSSFKETELERANLQLSFHENERLKVNGVDCVRVDTDIDYYRRFAHGFREVIPNLVLHRRSNPLRVFQLRWQATKRKQSNGGEILDFAPLIGLRARAH